MHLRSKCLFHAYPRIFTITLSAQKMLSEPNSRRFITNETFLYYLEHVHFHRVVINIFLHTLGVLNDFEQFS